MRVTTRKLKPLRERRIRGKRYWENHKGQVFPAVTTVLSIIDSGWVKEWKDGLGEDVAKKVKKEIGIDQDIYNSIIKYSGKKTSGLISGISTSIGTKAHSIIETYLSNKKINIYAELYPLSHFNNIKEFIDKIDRIRVLEAHLYSESLGIAGRVDAVCDYEGEKCVVDFKTSSKMKGDDQMLGYFLQVTAYALMWNELQRDNIKIGVIIMSSGEGQRKVFKVNIMEYVDQLKDIIKKYKTKNES